MTLRAHWIWLPNEPAPRNAVVDFRRVVELPQLGEQAMLHISADARYLLFVNGQQIGYGPARAYQYNYQYDSYDVAAHLRPGTNTLAVRVIHWGVSTLHHMVARGGLLVQLDTAPPVHSNWRWRVRRSPAYLAPTPRIAFQVGWEEQVDGRNSLADWMESDYDDSGWEQAEVIGPAGIAPWGELSPRRVPFLSDELITPLWIRACGLAQRPRALLSANLQPYTFPGDLSANMRSIDALLAAVVRVKEATELTFHHGQVYDEYPRCWLDGQPLGFAAGQANLVATRRVAAGEHLIVLDWHAKTYDLDLSLAISGAAAVELVLQPEPTPHLWLVAPEPGAGRAAAHAAVTLADLRRCDIGWQPVALADTPTADAYLDASASLMLEPADHVQRLPLQIAPIPPGCARHYLIDFGRELLGWISFEIEAGAGTTLDIVGLEAVRNERMQFAEHINNSLRYICHAGRQSYRSLCIRGLRYLLVAVHSAPGTESTLHQIALRQATYPVQPVGSFHSPDARLNQIWEMCAYTERLCSLEVFSSDCAYEQAIWVGDAYSQLLVHHVVYGTADLPDATFRAVADSLHRTPIANSQAPSGWENALIPNWSWLWALGCWQQYWFTGDMQFVRDMYPAMAKQAQFAVETRRGNPHGLFTLPGHWHFLDWSAIDTAPDYILAHENCLLAAALRVTAAVAQLLDRPAEAERWRSAADALGASVNAIFWSDAEGAYVDSLHDDGTLSQVVSQATNLIALFSGVAVGERAERLRAVVMAPPPHWVEIGSPFMFTFALEVLARNGRHAEALDEIRARWGEMLDRGATTCWETFYGKYPGIAQIETRSWCHAWSATPAVFLAQQVLGVTPLEPGYRRVRVAPHPAGLPWASGIVPTVHGLIIIEWSACADGQVDVRCRVPEGCRVEFDPACVARVVTIA